MRRFAGLEDALAIEREMPWQDRDTARTMHAFLARAARAHGDRPAVSFQILSRPGSKAETLSWAALHADSCRAANLFRELGVGEGDTVAYLLPICNEAVIAFLGGAIAGIVNPVNPLLDAEQIASILRETGARVLVTLKGFPQSDVAQKAADAAALAPGVETILEVDLNRYLAPPKSWIVPLLRPRTRAAHKARVLDFRRALAGQPPELSFADAADDRVAAYFHTGGTTGMPKVAQHRYSGMVYNGWLGATLLFDDTDTIICPLPLFHVFAVEVFLMSAIASGAHLVFPTPKGYRGDGVMDNFWKLIAHWRITFIATVPTALSALMQRPVDADVSSVKTAFSGSSPLPIELYRRFEAATQVTIVEGYGLTEATCLVSVNPVEGEKRIGSVGIPFPYTDVKILVHAGGAVRECATDEVGEICVASPGVNPGSIYTEPDRNHDLFHRDVYLRTGDLGRLDADGYLWITGRMKDMIIRGGHNIDPAEIEETLAGHPDVAMAGATGQPDAHAGELPCVYVQLVAGATATEDDLMAHLHAHIHERAAIPKHLEILDELPLTAVGKVFKPELRRRAIARVYDAALAEAGLTARVAEVVEDRKRGLVARLTPDSAGEAERIGHVLGAFTRSWEFAD